MKKHCLPIAVTFVFMAVTLGGGQAYGQVLECLAAPADTSDFLKELNIEDPYPEHSGGIVVSLWIHVLRQTSGSGGLSSSDVDELVADLATDMAQAGIFFTIAGEADIDSTSWYNDPIGNASSLFATNSHSDAIDAYLGPSTGDTVRVDVESIPSKALVISGPSVGTSALSHAVGHCLGLFDTHETEFGIELANSTNGSSAGDMVADTPADPGLSLAYVDEDCDLTSAFETAYPYHDPETCNVMVSGRVTCAEEFTTSQENRMYATLDSVISMAAVVDEQPLRVAYTNVSEDTYINDENQAQPRNAAAFDIGGDTDKDLIIAYKHGTSQSATVWEQTSVNSAGVPAFTEVSVFEIGETPPAGTTGLILADYDQNEYIDFFAPTPCSPGSRLYRNVAGHFYDVTSETDLDDLPQAQCGGVNADCTHAIGGSWGDYDGDGYVDLLIQVPTTGGTDCSYVDAEHAPGAITQRLLRNVTGTVGGDGGFVDMTDSTGVGFVASGWSFSGLWADYDRDYDVDLILMPSSSVGNTVYLQNRLMDDGYAHFADVTISKLGDLVKRWEYSSGMGVVTDITLDGWLDILYYNDSGFGYFRNAASGGAMSTTNSSHNVAGKDGVIDIEAIDYDLDRRIDMLITWASQYAKDPKLYRQYDGVVEEEPHALIELPSAGFALSRTDIPMGLVTADFNEDGYSEVYMSAEDVPDTNSTGEFFFKAAVQDSFTKYNWIGIRLRSEGFSNNYLGIGATVIMSNGGWTTAQVVDGGSGRSGQKDLDLVFGLKGSTNDIDIEVMWPNGNHQYFEDLDRNQYHTLEDEYPEIDASSISATTTSDPSTGDETWKFEWQTNCLTNPLKDKVTIGLDSGHRCWPGATVLQSSMGSVTVSIADSGSYFAHELEWTDVPCEANCIIPYTIESGQGEFTDTSSQKSFKILICSQTP